MLPEFCDLYVEGDTLEEEVLEGHDMCEAGDHMFSMGPMKGGGMFWVTIVLVADWVKSDPESGMEVEDVSRDSVSVSVSVVVVAVDVMSVSVSYMEIGTCW